MQPPLVAVVHHSQFNMQNLSFCTEKKITAQQYIALLSKTSLGERRPIQEINTVETLLQNSNLIISVWSGDELVGIARCVTDFAFCCYLSDLAVSDHYQKLGIGKQLIQYVQASLRKGCTLVLLAAPKAEGYYPKIGFIKHHSAWIKKSD